MGDALDARVGAFALVLAACNSGAQNEPLRIDLDPKCRAHLVSVQREALAGEDAGLWELDVHRGPETLSCRSSRGGWVCPSQTATGRPGSGAGRVPRGLPQRTTISILPEEGDDSSTFTYEVRRNGVVRFLGPASCGGSPPTRCAPTGDYSIVRVLGLP